MLSQSRAFFGNSRLIVGVATAVLVASCNAASIQPAGPPAPLTTDASGLDATDPYRRAGFIVGDGPLPFVGLVRYFGDAALDTTVAILALSIPPRALSFVRAGDRYAAYFAVRIDILSGESLLRSERPTGEVRVASFLETMRGDDGVIFQHTLRIAPGSYSIRVTAQDSLSSNTGVFLGPISVPVMANGVVAPIFPVFAAELRSARDAPLVAVANPRATVRYGRDTVLQLYVEGYGAAAPDSLVFISRPAGDPSITLRRDTVVLPKNRETRSARLVIPTTALGLGLIDITASRTGGAPIGTAVAMVTIGEEVPMTTVDDLLDALRYFASETEIRALRDANPERRGTLWAALVRQTDPNPSTPGNEALHEYLRRIAAANTQYREDTRPVWLNDRGAVVIALGEPDAVSSPLPVDSTSMSRLMTWEYRRHRLRLVFFDQAGLGRWRLTPASDAEFHTLLSIAGPCVGCR